MGIDVDLLFHPVGQGMFASGHLKRTNSNDTEFSWIYDCGSASAGQLEIGAVNRLAAHLGGPKPRIDLLVISHFDHDHISGIPHLLSTFDVKRILIPLVPLWARLLVASQLGLSITQEEQSLILDPVGTLSALPEGNAPDEIVIVSQMTGGDERSPPWEPEGSPDEPSFEIHVEKDERERNPEATPGYSPVAAGSRTEISWLRKSGRITVGNLWEFVPYNDPITIGMASPALVNQALVLNGQLLSATSQQQRAAVLAAIKSLYQMTFVSSESRNRLSLFMYAGASQKLHRTHREFNGWWRTYPGLPATPDRRGVLYTGDGTLKAKKAWTALDHFMGSQRLAHLIAMQVMHHGSNSNWHKGLAGKINPETAVFPADPHYQYRHPHGVVWDDFASCSIPILVDTRMPCHLTQRFS